MDINKSIDNIIDTLELDELGELAIRLLDFISVSFWENGAIIESKELDQEVDELAQLLKSFESVEV